MAYAANIRQAAPAHAGVTRSEPTGAAERVIPPRVRGGRAVGIIEPTAGNPPRAVTETDSRGVPPRARHGRQRAPRARGGGGQGKTVREPQWTRLRPCTPQAAGTSAGENHPWPKPS